MKDCARCKEIDKRIKEIESNARKQESTKWWASISVPDYIKSMKALAQYIGSGELKKIDKSH
jgi:hypothetical protein